MDTSAAEVARLFGVNVPAPSNAPPEVYPGRPGMVVVGGELRSMVWGFPFAMKGKNGQKLKPRPVNNTRTDKLDSFMWRFSFQERRCLIPVTEFAEAEGEKGSKTRTWFSLPDRPIFAIAGIWRGTDEWGPAYSMVMTDAGGIVADVHDRMPVILRPDDWSRWTDAPAEEARPLCVPYTGEVAMNRTSEPWVRR